MKYDLSYCKQDQIEQLELHLQQRLCGRVHDLRLFHVGDGMIIKGDAQTYYAKQLAEHLLMELASVPIAANEIEVGRREAATV